MTKQSMRGRRRKLLLTASLLVVPMIACGAAQAQAIDYDALEQLFGEPVTASATGQPQRASEAPANMIIVTAEEIRRSGARNIPDILRNVAGVDALEWTNGATDIGLRGYDKAYSARVLVLVDGRQVYADHYGFMPWNVLGVELGSIRQIEIVKGPNAALFGFNAVGGVINIVTRDPGTDKAHVEVPERRNAEHGSGLRRRNLRSCELVVGSCFRRRGTHGRVLDPDPARFCRRPRR